MEIINKNNKKLICEKCQKNSKIYNKFKFLCVDCFEEIINHKFRANLRTVCKIRHEDYLLICISGGNNSMCMLHMFYKSFTQNKTNKKLFFKIKILYIDDSIFLKDKDKIIETRNKNKEFIENITNQYNFKDYQIINLENIMDINNNDLNILDINTNMNLIEKYFNIYDNISKVGGFKNKFIKITIQNLIFYYAIKYNFTKIIYGINGQNLINNSFNSIILGNGVNIRHEIDHLDNTFLNGKINILKPLQDFSNKEILLYNHYNKVNILYPYYKIENINIIINDFFENLQNQKPNTLYTVINTIEKLSNKIKENIKCKFCLNELNDIKSELEFGIDNFLNIKECILNKELCYQCRRMFSFYIKKNDINENKKILLLFNFLNNLN